MSDPKAQAVLKPAATASSTALTTRNKLQQTFTSELVIALCGPIGSPIHTVADRILEVLHDKFDYQQCEIIRLSDFIKKYDPTPVPIDEYGKIKELIRRGDVL